MATITWVALDSVSDNYVYLPRLQLQCEAGEHSFPYLFVSGVPIAPRSIHVAAIKWAGVPKPEMVPMEMESTGDILTFLNPHSTLPGPDSRKIIRGMLLHPDSLLIGFEGLFGHFVIAAFDLGSKDSLRAGIERALQVCDWFLDGDQPRERRRH